MMKTLNQTSKSLLFRKLRSLTDAKLRILDDGSTHEFGERDVEFDNTIIVRDPSFYRKTLLGGALGAAESYLDGDWDCRDLTGLIRIATRNLSAMDRLSSGFGWANKQMERMINLGTRNSLGQSKKNIHEHYDLGNNFFKTFLDPTMNYSAGIFQRPDDSMMKASINKMWQACAKLELNPSDHLLEIGTGWGSLAIFAARHFGCRVTTTTISDEQYDFARKRVAQAGLENRVRVVKQDYRQLRGSFDKIVSIEMIEAVGHKYLDSFFEQCYRLLDRDGKMLIQTITIQDQRHAAHLKNTDFIKKYIFPGGCLPSLQSLLESMSRKTGFQMAHLSDLGIHYAQTIANWKAKFDQNAEAIASMQLGSERFMRMWNYYLCYCQAGFLERQISNVQLLLCTGDANRHLESSDYALSQTALSSLNNNWNRFLKEMDGESEPSETGPMESRLCNPAHFQVAAY